MFMTLSDVLKEYGNRDFNVIEYRKTWSVDSDDVDGLDGMAQYKNKMLISLDDGEYYFMDEISKHKLFRDDWLIVWRG